MEVFKNMIYLDFSNPEIRKKQEKEIHKVRSLFGKEYPNIIGGKKVKSEKKTISLNPANYDEKVGIFQKGGKEDAEMAMQAALKAFESWKMKTPKERSAIVLKAAKIMKRRRLEINAWMISEVGKNYLEADADTCEAIDFLEFYGREALRYGKDQDLTKYKGEKNRYYYIPLGVGLVVPPWNFPLAILVGMSTAAIVTGNTIILKPSSESPMMGWLYQEIMHEAGLPPGVLNFFVASGAESGDYLVTHPKTRFISFTGSMEVGLRINELAAKNSPGQIWIKRVVAEMGGKDGIIVDSEADIDAAVEGVVTSAFGFQGQKCSACSRAIVDKKIYDTFVKKLKIAVDKLEQGDPKENIKIGPVVSAKAEKSILEYIEIGKKEGKLLNGGSKVKGVNGYYIQPTVFIDIDPNARLAQEEIFGPVLAVIKSKDFNDSLRIANNTQFGLTGAIYTKNKEKLARATEEFHVGNLYLNRKCTGALVDVHPFGGFNMSGTDSKAGSRDYLMLFQQGKSVSEKIIK